MWPYFGAVRSFAPIYFAGILAHFVIALLFARRLRLKWPVPALVSTCYLLGMTVGARALFDLNAGSFSVGSLFTGSHYLQGGMWGGPLAYLSLAVPVVLVVSRNRRAALDLIALAAPIPMAIAKVACLCHGCCYGKPTNLPWAITFSGGGPAPAGVPLHPTQIYEILVLLCAMVVLYCMNQPRWRGTLLLWFLAVYGVGRPLTEFFRGDLAQQPSWGPFSRSQWMCAIAAGLAICVLLLYNWWSQRAHSLRLPQARQPAPD